MTSDKVKVCGVVIAPTKKESNIVANVKINLNDKSIVTGIIVKGMNDFVLLVDCEVFTWLLENYDTSYITTSEILNEIEKEIIERYKVVYVR